MPQESPRLPGADQEPQPRALLATGRDRRGSDDRDLPRCILAVDDDGATLELLRLVLEAAGYAVATAGSVGEARALIGAGPPALVLCDARLPEAPPLALLDALAADPATAQLPVLVCSGAVHEIEQAGDRLARPGIGVLLKPFDLDDLLAAVERLLPAEARVGSVRSA